MIQGQIIAAKVGAQTKSKIDLIGIALGNMFTDFFYGLTIGKLIDAGLPARKLKFPVTKKFARNDFATLFENSEPQQRKYRAGVDLEIGIEPRRGFVGDEAGRVQAVVHGGLDAAERGINIFVSRRRDFFNAPREQK